MTAKTLLPLNMRPTSYMFPSASTNIESDEDIQLLASFGGLSLQQPFMSPSSNFEFSSRSTHPGSREAVPIQSDPPRAHYSNGNPKKELSREGYKNPFLVNDSSPNTSLYNISLNTAPVQNMSLQKIPYPITSVNNVVPVVSKHLTNHSILVPSSKDISTTGSNITVQGIPTFDTKNRLYPIISPKEPVRQVMEDNSTVAIKTVDVGHTVQHVSRLQLKVIARTAGIPKQEFISNETRKEANVTSMTFYDMISDPSNEISKYIHPHKHCLENVNQDAFYMVHKARTTSNNIEFWSFGVADGVSGWSDAYRQVWDGIEMKTIPYDKLLKSIYAASYNEVFPTYEGGSSTYCSLFITKNMDPSLNHSAYLRSTTLGDSRYAIIGQYQTTDGKYYPHLRVVSQYQRDGNAPYQLAVIPRDYNGTDRDQVMNTPPEEAIDETHVLNIGDIILVGSDGVWDNVDEGLTDVLTLYHTCVQNNEKISTTEQLEDFLKKIMNYIRKRIVSIKDGKLDDVTLIGIIICDE